MSCLKKVSLSVATLAVSASMFAGTDLDSRVRELEKEMKQVRTETAGQTFGANTASARPDVDGHGFFVSFDVLYWQLKAGGTEYCYTDVVPSTSSTAWLPVKGHLKDISFNKWDWGFRAGLGYNFEHGEWDAYVNYTYFRVNNSGTTTATPLGSVRMITQSAIVDNGTYNNVLIVNKASSHYTFSFNRIDLELGRDFFVAQYLSLRPHVGLVTAWINQHQRTQFTGLDLQQNVVTLENKNDVWGIGPGGGINTTWHLCNGFSVIGNMSGALVYGRFDMSYTSTFSLNPNVNYRHLNADMHRFTPTAQIQLGFGYDTSIADDTHHISLWLGWDVQYWWRVQQQLKQELDYARLGEDLSLQGATLHFKWDF